jgi:hypothetical protein
VAVLLAATALAALPGFAGGLRGWVAERVEPPVAVVDPGLDLPTAETPQPREATDPPADEGAAGGPDPPFVGGAPDRDDDQGDDDSEGSGRSGGGGSSGPG